MSFQQGLSGLNAASKTLEVIGNNVANANTVGFKESQAQFADLYAESLSGGGAGQIGIGTKISRISQLFSQGNITATNNPLDIAISGRGFFRMSTNGTLTYSRNGQFNLDKSGYIVNASGAKLTGYVADANGILTTGAPAELNISAIDLAPLATNKVNWKLNLDSTSTIPTTPAFNVDDQTTYNKSTSISVYDSLGNSHLLQTFYVKTGPNSWNVYATADGTEVTKQAVKSAIAAATATSATPAAIGTDLTAAATASTAAAAAATAAAAAQTTAATTPAQIAAAAVSTANAAADTAAALGLTAAASAATTAAAGIGATLASTLLAANNSPVTPNTIGKLIFNSGGAIDTTAMAALVPKQILPFSVKFPLFPATGGTTPFSLNVDLSGTSQYGAAFSVNAANQDGYSSGRLSDFSISNDGTIKGRYTNSQSKTLGQVVMADFADPTNLQPLGNNSWAETSSSGVPLVGIASTGRLGKIQASSTEDSNVDLTEELVSMITAQRVYQANAQTIKPQDQLLQTLVNLR